MSSHLLGLHRHLLSIRLLNHHVVLHPLKRRQRKSLHLRRDVDGRALLHNDGVPLEELQDRNNWSDCG